MPSVLHAANPGSNPGKGESDCDSVTKKNRSGFDFCLSTFGYDCVECENDEGMLKNGTHRESIAES